MITDKWKKKLLLVKYGLSSLGEIEHQTKRFKSVSELRENIHLDSSIYIIKLVPRELRPKLKNFLITDMLSMERFLREVENFKDYVEIWACRNEYGNGLPVYGRIAINEIGQTLELVQADTARGLERLSLYPYLQARRPTWGWHYHSLGTLKFQHFQHIALEIERQRDTIEELILDLESIGILSLSLEFRVCHDAIVFIDWDTENDKEVLNKLW